jgi:hypothetical protein
VSGRALARRDVSRPSAAHRRPAPADPRRPCPARLPDDSSARGRAPLEAHASRRSPLPKTPRAMSPCRRTRVVRTADPRSVRGTGRTCAGRGVVARQMLSRRHSPSPEPARIKGRHVLSSPTPFRAAAPASPRHCRRRRCAPCSAHARRRTSLPRPSLDIPRVSRATHCASPPRASPESVRPRAHHRGLVAAARQSSPRPRHRHQSARGEPNCLPVPLLALAWPHLAAGEILRYRKGMVVKSRGICVD